VAQLHSDGTGDAAAAVAMYRRVLAEFDPKNAYCLHAVAELETKLGNHAAAAEALETLAATLGGITSALDQPEFATAIGLVKYGSLKNRQRPTQSMFGFKGMVTRLLQRS
jgi:hypothetical protein